MKIFSSPVIYPNSNYKNSNFNNKNLKENAVLKSQFQLYASPILFKAKSSAYMKAKEYLNKELATNKTSDLFKFDLKKLNGIQDGIKVFKDMTMAEIAFVLSTISEFATVRGCKNNCLHCYADAKPSIKETETHTRAMLWEDFVSLTDGISELNDRLGFNASSGKKFNSERYLTTFHDSDSLDVVLKDKLGMEHDFIEIADKLYDTMGVEVIFDTAGWNLNDKKSQERMEKYIKYYSHPDNRKKLDDINISFSPFHALHKREVELRKEGQIILADKMRNLYTDRMANTFFTFTPLLEDERFNVLGSVLPDYKTFEGFTISDTLVLFQETLEKLAILYKKDFEGEQRYIKSKTDIDKKISGFDEKLAARYISFLEKASDYFGTGHALAKFSKNKLLETMSYVEKDINSIDKFRNSFVGLLDANGDFYLTNYEITLPTEIKLNFDNRRKTAPIKPNLKEEYLIKRSDINNL